MSSPFASTFSSLVGIRKTGENEYTSLSNPEKMGNNANIAYGGCAIAVALMAAHSSLPRRLSTEEVSTSGSPYRLFSATGSFLGPALSDRVFNISVRKIRDTITFATRHVELSQVLDDGSKRSVILVLADFQRPESQTLLQYSTPPLLSIPDLEGLLNLQESKDKMVQEGKVNTKVAAIHGVTFGLMGRHFDQMPHPKGVMSQNLFGMAKTVVTSQDELPLVSKVSGDFVKTKLKLETQAENAAALGFVMDGALSFIPLTHSHLFLEDAGACSSLEFALRVFVNDLNFGEWHLKEMSTVTGEEGRTYSEARLWDRKGNMVANMTQQSILRPPGPKKAKRIERL